MNLFSRTTAEYTCTKHCGYHRSIVGANLSRFDLLAAVVATIPMWLLSLREQFPWYYFVSIFAGELLFLILAGILMGLVMMPYVATVTARCKNCGAPMFCAGRHFDPKGTSKPHLDDIIIFLIFIGANVACWVVFTSGNA